MKPELSKIYVDDLGFLCADDKNSEEVILSGIEDCKGLYLISIGEKNIYQRFDMPYNRF